MKKTLILAIVLLGIVVSTLGQVKSTKDIIEPINTNIVANTTSVSTANNNITTLQSSTAGTAYWTISSDSDSMYFTNSEGTVIGLFAGSITEIDNTAPLVSEINISSDTATWTFNEPMDVDSIATGVTLTEDGNDFGIGAFIFQNSTTLKVPLDSVAEVEKSYLFDYSRPGLNDFQDVAGNKLLSFINTEAINNVATPSTIYSYMLFNDNDNDEEVKMTFTWTDTEAYRTTGSPPEGTHSTSASSGAAMYTNQTHDFDSVLTFAGWFNSGNDGDAIPRTLLKLDGLLIEFVYTDGAQYLQGIIGGQAFKSTLISDLTAEWLWTHMVVSYDGTNGIARTYINGVNVSSDSIVGTYSDLNGIVNIMWDGVDGELFGDSDDIHFYNGLLSDAKVLELKENPGIPVDGSTDPPLPPGSFEVLHHLDWSTMSVTNTHEATSPVGIDEDDLDANIVNWESLGSDDAINPNYADNADIVLFGGDEVMKSWYLEGQCCTGALSDVAAPSNGGTGFDGRYWITGQSTYYSEDLYLTWPIYIMPGFINPKGFKQPTLAIDKGGYGSARLMITSWQTDFDPQYYNWAHWTLNGDYSVTSPTWGNLDVVANAKTGDWITTGRWVWLTLRVFPGTTRGVNGRTELFVDGIYIGSGISSIPFINNGDPTGLSYVEISTFMGGASTTYTSPIDQWILVGDLWVGRYTEGANVPTGGTPSSSNPPRDIRGMLREHTSFPY